jgi:hypothetical protein
VSGVLSSHQVGRTLRETLGVGSAVRVKWGGICVSRGAGVSVVSVHWEPLIGCSVGSVVRERL